MKTNLVIGFLILTFSNVYSEASSGTGISSVTESVIGQLVSNTRSIQNAINSLSSELKQVQDALLDVKKNTLTTRTSVQRILEQIFHTSCDDDDRMGMLEPKLSSGINVRTILLSHAELMQVTCESDGTNIWTVILSRFDGSLRFDKTFEEYSKGFGDPLKEFYIGNDALHEITNSKPHVLKVELEDFSSHKATAFYRYVYRVFRISDRKSRYRLTVEKFDQSCSKAGDALSVHNGQEFSTHDQPSKTGRNCSATMGGRGGWWYTNCYHALGTGNYRKSQGNEYGGLSWWPWHNVKHSLKRFKMMIRPFSNDEKNKQCL